MGINENNIKFSILLPTKDRLELLKYAIESIRRQTYTNWELIIADNNSKCDIATYVSELQDERIVYYRQPVAVSVTENWVTANNLGTGEYYIMLGDDDALLENALEILHKHIVKKNPDVIAFPAYLYLQAGVDENIPQGEISFADPFVQFGCFSEGWLDLKWRKYVARCALDFQVTIGYNMQYYCYSKGIINTLKQYGDFYEPPYPDYFATPMMLMLAKHFLYIQDRIVVIGVTPKSYGAYYRRNEEKAGMVFHKEADYRDFALPIIREKLCDCDEMDTAALVTYAVVCHKLSIDMPDIIAYYKNVIKREAEYVSKEIIQEIINTQMKQHVGEKYKLLVQYAEKCYEKKKGVNYTKNRTDGYQNIIELINEIHNTELNFKMQRSIPYMDICDWFMNIESKIINQYKIQKKILIWGAYDRGIYLQSMLLQRDICIAGYIDNAYFNDTGKFGGCPVYKQEQIDFSTKEYYILIPLLHRDDFVLSFLNTINYERDYDFDYIGV